MAHSNKTETILLQLSGFEGFPQEQFQLYRGESLLEAVRRQAPNMLEAPCGGHGTCGKCKVRVLEGDTSPLSREEQQFLSDAERRAGVRLACCFFPQEAVTFSVPDSREHRIMDAVGEIPELPRPAYGEGYGLAVDIGTTTVAAYLVSFNKRTEIRAISSRLNPQRSWGADVISRISFAGEGKEQLDLLCNSIRDAVSSMGRELLRQEGASIEALREVVIAGNTCMLHLFSNTDPTSLAVAPFRPQFTEQWICRAEEFALPFPKAQLRLLPSLAAYVGADITAGIAAVNLDRSEGLELLLDLGTNGEMALGNREKMLCCATAAGPAFEGAGISCGTGGIPGAIDRVYREGARIAWTSIDNQPPQGICGSGILDLTAVLLKTGVVDGSGAIIGDNDEVTLYEGEERKISFLQRDIRQIQLAKGAVAAGISTLLDEWGAEASDIQKVHLAGGFGNYLHPDSAVQVGLIPSVCRNRIYPARNSAGWGAVRCLLYREEADRIDKIAAESQYIELSTDPRFQRFFMEEMLFPSIEEPIQT